MRVYGLMVTQAGREGLAAEAISDFAAQGYADRELVVVVDRKDGRTLGELRNEGLAQIPRDGLVMIWDDDDRSHPERIEEQVRALEASGADVMCLSRVMLQCECGETVRSIERDWECTMVARRDALPCYMPMERGEDSELLRRVRDGGGKVGRHHGAEWLMVKRFHGGNTWGRRHNAVLFSRSGHRCERLIVGVADA